MTSYGLHPDKNKTIEGNNNDHEIHKFLSRFSDRGNRQKMFRA